MYSGDREEFERQLRSLCAGYDKPVGDRVDAYWRGLEKMDLATFARIVEHCLAEGGPDKMPTTGQCWQISRKLRAPRPVFEHEKPKEHVVPGDAWDRVANHHLWDYIQLHVRRRPSGRYGSSQYGGVGKPPIIEADMRARVQCLIDAKNYWALEMREGGAAEHDPAYQKRCWEELMVAAEQRIDALIAGHPQRAAA